MAQVEIDPFFNEPEYEGPYNAAHGFQRLMFANLQVGDYYVMKEMEKYTAAHTGEVTYQTAYYYIRILAKTASEIKYHRYMGKYSDEGSWEHIELDPDQEEWPIEVLEKEFVNGPEISGNEHMGLTVFMRHFYEPGEASNALSDASSTFSNHNNNNGGSAPDVNYMPEVQSPQLSPVSSYSNSNYIVGGRKKIRTKRLRLKLKKTRRNKKRTHKRK